MRIILYILKVLIFLCVAGIVTKLLGFFISDKKKEVPLGLMDISAQHISTGNMIGYILYLAEVQGIEHLGFTYDNINGFTRFIILCHKENKKAMQYFSDRVPAIVEYEVLQFGDYIESIDYYEQEVNGITEYIPGHK